MPRWQRCREGKGKKGNHPFFSSAFGGGTEVRGKTDPKDDLLRWDEIESGGGMILSLFHIYSDKV